LALLVMDCATKRAVEHRLAVGESQAVVSEVVRFTLSYNQNAAMSIDLGGESRRLVLSALTIAALVVLGILYHRTRPTERLRVIGIALVAGGALGNLVDRIRSSAGVVDFIDVGVAHMAAAVATPLEKQFSTIAGLDAMTSCGSGRSTSPTWASPSARCCYCSRWAGRSTAGD